jgi:phospholipid/cholesterol/gamma-HCH transport system substrate-binding protein
MADQETSIEIKVGALVLVALSLLVGFILLLGDIGFGSGRSFHVVFDNAGGLKPGADVAVAGLNVGRVESLEFVEREQPETGPAVAVRATVRVGESHADAVRQNSEFYISTRSVLGEPYIEVVTPSLSAPPVESGAVVQGTSPPRFDRLAAKAGNLLDALNRAIEDPDVRLEDVLANAASLLTHADRFLVEHEEDLSRTVEVLPETLTNFRNVTASLEKGLQQGEGLRATLRDLQVTARRARAISRSLEGHIGPIVDDVSAAVDYARAVGETADTVFVQRQDTFAAAVDNLHASTEDIAATSKDARAVVSRIEEGEGTVGQLLNDREMYDDMRELLRIVKRQPWRILWKE